MVNDIQFIGCFYCYDCCCVRWERKRDLYHVASNAINQALINWFQTNLSFYPLRKRSLTAHHIPFDADDLLVLICNSNVKHELSSSEYPTRRNQCSEALKLMGLKSYREANLLNLRGEFSGEATLQIDLHIWLTYPSDVCWFLGNKGKYCWDCLDPYLYRFL